MGTAIKAEEREYLERYDITKFERPSVTTDVLIFTTTLKRELKIMLLRRTEPPFAGEWALPGGFVGMDESLEDAAFRILKDKTNVENVHLEQLYTFGDVNRDPRTRVISVAYLALVPWKKVDELQIKALSGTDEICWADVKLNDNSLKITVPGISGDLSLAFDHERIIKLAIERMRGKINYTDLAIHLLNDPCRFAILELQRIYEAILDRKLDVPNFRRMFMKGYVQKGHAELLNETCSEYLGRNSKYYTVK